MEKIPIKKNDYDPVNKPEHYTSGKYECIDVMVDVFGKEMVQNFCICNTFKYLYRYKKKNGIQDVRKGKWYIDKFIELEDEDDDSF